MIRIVRVEEEAAQRSMRPEFDPLADVDYLPRLDRMMLV